MKTVKQVAALSGVSVRTLQYYDEIGLLKPARVSDSGYRLYDEENLKTLQQILFFKELDFPLKAIKEIMKNPEYNRIEAFQKQKILIQAKRDRLNRLLALLEKLETGESCMSFQEFDMNVYFQMLEQFKQDNTAAVIRGWGSLKSFDHIVQKIRSHEEALGKEAVREYGSVETFTEAMKKNLKHFSENTGPFYNLSDYAEQSKALYQKLTADLTKEVNDEEVQATVGAIVQMVTEKMAGTIDLGTYYWDKVIEAYQQDAGIKKANDGLYGPGASEYIGKAFQYYFHKQLL